MRVEGHIVDLHNREIYDGAVEVEGGVIRSITRCAVTSMGYIMVGFVDSHVHIESSMLTPEHFGDMVIRHGTVAVVTDPHEIANVMGTEGVEFMLESGSRAPIKIFFAIPSCVPATPFDRAGGEITAADVESLARSGRFVALAEMMNVPGVLAHDKEVMEKLTIATRYGLRVDGHAPLLTGDALRQYAECGITTDHETVSLSEAREKIACGMKIEIRDGSAAQNYSALAPLIGESPREVMFCSDDSHPDETLRSGHINRIVRRAVADGYPLFDVLRAASIHAIDHYGLDVGQLRVGDRADFIIVDDLCNFATQSVYIDGEQRYNAPTHTAPAPRKITLNNFHHSLISAEQLRCRVEGEISVIGLIENEIVTREERYTPCAPIDNLESDVERDLAKIVYMNRYTNGAPQVAYCRGFGLKRGAIASSISHDSHNVIAVGISDFDIAKAINVIISHNGGLAVCDNHNSQILPLPIAGIMSDEGCEAVAAAYSKMQGAVSALGSPLAAPFMTLSMLSLIVIPELKISERGLFRYSTFSWVES